MTDDTTNARSGNEVAAVWVDITALKQWNRNPRQNDDNVARVAKSIKRFGFSSPIIAREADGEIIAGHTRYLAALSLGLTKAPVRYMDLDPAEAHLLALADNRLNELSPWDTKELQSVQSDYSLPDAELAGWSGDDIDKMAGEMIGEMPEPDGEPPMDEKCTTCPKCGHEF